MTTGERVLLDCKIELEFADGYEVSYKGQVFIVSKESLISGDEYCKKLYASKGLTLKEIK